ncbi:MAG TPA: hypothetical protein VKE22_22585 [Haliangiales bacterium]|nr:hypothetical protein [Haliangiales bacterium]
MRRLIVLAFILAAAGAALWWFWLRPSAGRACGRMADLCGLPDASCREHLDRASDETSARLARCLLEAKTCPEAIGCAAGAGTRELEKAGKEAFDGFKRALDK